MCLFFKRCSRAPISGLSCELFSNASPCVCVRRVGVCRVCVCVVFVLCVCLLVLAHFTSFLILFLFPAFWFSISCSLYLSLRPSCCLRPLVFHACSCSCSRTFRFLMFLTSRASFQACCLLMFPNVSLRPSCCHFGLMPCCSVFSE